MQAFCGSFLPPLIEKGCGGRLEFAVVRVGWLRSTRRQLPRFYWLRARFLPCHLSEGPGRRGLERRGRGHDRLRAARARAAPVARRGPRRGARRLLRRPAPSPATQLLASVQLQAGETVLVAPSGSNAV